MIEILPHLISGGALMVAGWVWNSSRELRETVHDLELRQVRTETQAQHTGAVLDKMAENMATKHDVEAVKAALCQRIDDLRSQ